MVKAEAEAEAEEEENKNKDTNTVQYGYNRTQLTSITSRHNGPNKRLNIRAGIAPSMIAVGANAIT
ncbi:uncharacterized protein ACLA_011780 [Aspergillus clavatus NRRL 1]|uniref:Uncharacterized protein n=1 Tax=Aspergillus clavatus (strain ATCC 1007 / CBS 513.65 / DSM 816 / NCTC 3887 / NRRL 1 / QM 1276 / 107) TaxID=344612 RepID=A1CAI3_ASPCL|nr:uncharacterized protein ACLA_011780 [Aspergillus clavatus NRRL 1]EAW12751.1 hypothetical protein ACLA_011780 [Aspergillus clavatus NRRL 1]